MISERMTLSVPYCFLRQHPGEGDISRYFQGPWNSRPSEFGLTSASAPVPHLTARDHLQGPSGIFILQVEKQIKYGAAVGLGGRGYLARCASSCFVCSKAPSCHPQQQSGIIPPLFYASGSGCGRPIVVAQNGLPSLVYNENNSKTIARVCRISIHAVDATIAFLFGFLNVKMRCRVQMI